MLRGLISGTECIRDKKIGARDSHLEWARFVAGELGDGGASGKSAAEGDLIAAGEEIEAAVRPGIFLGKNSYFFEGGGRTGVEPY
jgi:hypothetical protein